MPLLFSYRRGQEARASICMVCDDFMNDMLLLFSIFSPGSHGVVQRVAAATHNPFSSPGADTVILFDSDFNPQNDLQVQHHCASAWDGVRVVYDK